MQPLGENISQICPSLLLFPRFSCGFLILNYHILRFTSHTEQMDQS